MSVSTRSIHNVANITAIIFGVVSFLAAGALLAAPLF